MSRNKLDGAGISWTEKTDVVVFEWTMNSDGYKTILKQSLLPFLKQIYPDGHCLMQDNDMHTDKGRG